MTGAVSSPDAAVAASHAIMPHLMRSTEGDAVVARHGQNSAAARLHLVDGVGLLRPEDQVFEAMLDGWRAQQQARNLAATTIKSRRHAVRAFAAHAEAFPWRWGASDYNDWLGDLRGVRGLRRTTLRAYEDGVRSFGTYLTDPAYDWPAVCEERFGSHPVQVVNMWNTAAHTQESEGDPSNRPFSRCELETLFDYADEQVSRVRGRGRKGWLPAFRDATMFKLAYAYGLRRREVQMLGVADFGPNPHAAEFGDYGVVYVRHGKGKAGSDPRERSVCRSGTGAARSSTSGSARCGRPTQKDAISTRCGPRNGRTASTPAP